MSELDEVQMPNGQVYLLLLVADFRLLQWFNVDVNFILGSLYDVDVDSVADISGILVACIFRVRVCKLISFCVCTALF